ncbi:hypothetical protein [Enterococcus termitis]|uniref:Uncharacterized protein n=1 Tax=Enterococcus termitis TaxID=332950 RepID=A0A1E5GTZ4_9ENTE|nr:hypothetical protein [Enterococcus termitis]OEG16164.1 hypothetical protein BCR25_18385 [Enterococcus termitis]OJG96816.1 hypothetical protein RV18_GL001862 [Enterococcus termitis]
MKKSTLDYLENEKKFRGRLLSYTVIASYHECLEKQHLKEIADQLTKEGFKPEEFRLVEIPIDGVYTVERAYEKAGTDFFTADFVNGDIGFSYTTEKCDKNGYNCFPCDTIKESMKLTEC